MLTVSPDCSAVSASEHLLLRVLVRIATLFFSVIKIEYAGMAELADALDSGSSESNFIQVQVLLPAPNSRNPNPKPVGEGFGFLWLFVNSWGKEKQKGIE